MKKILRITGEELLWLSNPPTHIIVYLLANFTALVGWIFFKGLHRVRIYDNRKITWRKNMIVLTNHKSMIDSFMIGTVMLWPKVLWRPSLIPMHLAAKENFSRPHLFTRILKWLIRRRGIGRMVGLFLRNSWVEHLGNFPTNLFFEVLFMCLRVFPIEPGRNDPRAIRLVKNALPKSVIHVFITAGRDIDENFDRIGRGIGFWVKRNRTHVLPVFFRGMEHIQVKGKVLPRLWPRQTNYLMIGEPIDFSDLMELSDHKDVFDMVTERCVESIKELGRKLTDKTSVK